ncbi:hypothetical protein HDV63DRAFT_404413 [Trichoderma sp. SZMC 28014]
MSTERNDNEGMNPTAAPFIPFASPQPSFATQRPKNPRVNVKERKHENKEAAWRARDQMPRPTAPNSSSPVHQNPSPRRFKTDSSDGLAQHFFLRRRSTRRTSRASGRTPQKSKADTSGKGAPRPLEATLAQQHRMSNEKAATETETNNGSVPEKDSQTMSMEGVLVPSSVPGPMPPNGHPGYEFSAVPPQLHGDDMIHHPDYSVSPSIYPPPSLHHHHPPPPPSLQGGCFPVLQMAPYQMIPSPTNQPQPPSHFAFAFPVAYWPHGDFPVGNPGSQIDQQNPDPDREQADPRSFGPLTHSYPHLMPHVQMPYMPHHVPGEHACFPDIDEKRVVDQSSSIIEISEPSDYYQSASERVKPPSVVDGPQAKRKTGEEVWQRIQQSRQVPLGPQQRHSILNQPAQQIARYPAMQSASVITSPSSRFSRRSHVPYRPAKLQTATSTEVASWSQSKRWVSSETKERRAFQKMVLNLQFMKADQSPFIPKTPAELTKFKISLAEAKQQKLAKEVKLLEEKNRNKELAKALGSVPVSQPQVLLFNGRQMEDKLSPVFAAQNCFNKEDTAEACQRVEWPSLAELKEEGDKRARFGRYLPLPRMNVVAPKILEREQESAYKADGSIL